MMSATVSVFLSVTDKPKFWKIVSSLTVKNYLDFANELNIDSAFCELSRTIITLNTSRVYRYGVGRVLNSGLCDFELFCIV